MGIENVGPSDLLRFERWARLFAECPIDSLNVTLGRRKASSAEAKRLARVLRLEAPDPNRKRLNLLECAQLATATWR